MPFDHRVRSAELANRAPVEAESEEPDPEQTIKRPQLRPFASALKGEQLMLECKIFCDQCVAADNGCS